MKIVITITRRTDKDKKVSPVEILATLILERLDKTLCDIRTDFDLAISRKVIS